ncbi:hypothetical protein ABIB40_003888 [Pedobacter sp. UYP30]|uniref:conjugative transposon protein TraM n=1 Tax=Pedobacter sp. UYP30 TaxID=1756400 RepID=UPI0033996976
MEVTKKNNRKVLLILPILIFPFLALAFYAMGGGKGDVKDGPTVQHGINTKLPDASFKQASPTDKMGFYQQSDRDSSRTDNAVKTVADRLGFNRQDDPHTAEINQKLEALTKEINKPAETASSPYAVERNKPENSSMKADVDRLESLMKVMNEDKNEDPEIAQLNGLMQSILEIQHPEKVREDILEKQPKKPDSLFRATPAVIANSQKVVQGATVKIVIQDSIRVNGILIPKDHELFGICRITNQRLLLDIKNIRLGTSIIPVDLSVYSLDGMVGIEAPEAMLSDAVNGGADNAVRNIRLGGLDQSFGIQAADAGIEAAKALLSKRVKRIKVKLEAGLYILLRNNKPNQSNR